LNAKCSGDTLIVTLPFIAEKSHIDEITITIREAIAA
jgi:hypothetical protein